MPFRLAPRTAFKTSKLAAWLAFVLFVDGPATAAGFGQSLNGIVAPPSALGMTALGSAYSPPKHIATTLLPPIAPTPIPKLTAPDLVAIYKSQLERQLQRLKTKSDHDLFIIMDSESGYIQFRMDLENRIIFCEAASVKSSPLIAQRLTHGNIARLHKAGFADPGVTPNYWKIYPLERFTDAAIAEETISLMHNVYNYEGGQPINILTAHFDSN
jgi:hypothetical protein